MKDTVGGAPMHVVMHVRSPVHHVPTSPERQRCNEMHGGGNAGVLGVWDEWEGDMQPVTWALGRRDGTAYGR
jgi:hypothetical protein